MLKATNPHPRDREIVFEEHDHKYTVNGCPKTTSVTRLVHQQFGEFDADAVIKGMMERESWPSSKYFGKTPEQIKADWAENGKAASAAGTKLHNDIESYYNNESYENESTEFQYFLAFDEWRKARGLIPYRAEWTVYDAPHLLAGTIDMCYLNPADGSICIYDWKRVKQLRRRAYGGAMGKTAACSSLPDSNYWHYSLQLGLYRWILETNYGFQVSETALVALHPDQPHYEIHTTDRLDQVVVDVLSSWKPS